MLIRKEIITFLILLLALQLASIAAFSQTGDDDKTIELRSRRHTVFSLFNEISRQTDRYFIYDSELVDNEKSVHIPKGEYSIDELLAIVVTKPELMFSFIDNYIIIHKKDDPPTAISPQSVDSPDKAKDSTLLTIKARVLDAQSGNPLPFAGVILKGTGKGISANADGLFSFKVPAIHINDTLKISYMGYASRYLPVSYFPDATMDIFMDIETKSLSEVVVRSYNPLGVLISAIASIPNLYPQHPAQHTSFYREGVFKNEDLLNYSEAIFNIYKTPYRGFSYDQVKLLKSRKIVNNDTQDSIMIKLKAGIQSMLELDVIKHPPQFLVLENLGLFKFPTAGYVAHNSGSAYMFTFESADYADENVYEGTIYIDRKSLAILQVDFRVTQTYLSQNQHYFITRRSKLHRTRIRSMEYSVRYALHDGLYHIQHVRGEIDMRIRERGKFFGNNYNAFFEMAVMNIDTEDVKRFPRRETIKPNVIFTDQEFVYDPQFWENFNIVLPEQDITRAMKNFNAGIERFDLDE